MVSDYLREFSKVYSDSLNKIDKYNERINVSDATYNVNAFNMGKVRVEEQDKNKARDISLLLEEYKDLDRSFVTNALDPNGGKYRDELFVKMNENLGKQKLQPMTRWEFDQRLIRFKEAEDTKKKDTIPLATNGDDAIKLINTASTAKDKSLVENDSIINNRIAGLLGLFPKTTFGSENTMVVKPAVVFSDPKTYNNAWKNIQNKIYRKVPDLLSSLKYKIELEKERK